MAIKSPSSPANSILCAWLDWEVKRARNKFKFLLLCCNKHPEPSGHFCPWGPHGPPILIVESWTQVGLGLFEPANQNPKTSEELPSFLVFLIEFWNYIITLLYFIWTQATPGMFWFQHFLGCLGSLIQLNSSHELGPRIRKPDLGLDSAKSHGTWPSRVESQKN